MILKKNDFLYGLQKKVIQEMQQHLQFGTVTIPAYTGDLMGSFQEAKTIMQWAEETVAMLETLKEPIKEPESK